MITANPFTDKVYTHFQNAIEQRNERGLRRYVASAQFASLVIAATSVALSILGITMIGGGSAVSVVFGITFVAIGAWLIVESHDAWQQGHNLLDLIKEAKKNPP